MLHCGRNVENRFILNSYLLEIADDFRPFIIY
jgi:hypothetical protein